MKILLLTKQNETGQQAKALVHQKIPRANLEVIAATDGSLPIRESWKCDWLLSVLCPWILPESILVQSTNNLNFHPGPPEYPGFGCYNFAIYDRATEYGVTCHRMNAKVDSGEIIAVRRFKIRPGTDIEMLQTASHSELLTLLSEVLDRIKTNDLLLPIKTWSRPPTSRKDFEALRCVPHDASLEEVKLRILAFGHTNFDGAYSEVSATRPTET